MPPPPSPLSSIRKSSFGPHCPLPLLPTHTPPGGIIHPSIHPSLNRRRSTGRITLVHVILHHPLQLHPPFLRLDPRSPRIVKESVDDGVLQIRQSHPLLRCIDHVLQGQTFPLYPLLLILLLPRDGLGMIRRDVPLQPGSPRALPPSVEAQSLLGRVRADGRDEVRGTRRDREQYQRVVRRVMVRVRQGFRGPVESASPLGPPILAQMPHVRHGPLPEVIRMRQRMIPPPVITRTSRNVAATIPPAQFRHERLGGVAIQHLESIVEELRIFRSVVHVVMPVMISVVQIIFVPRPRRRGG
mmetsp:Transcript_41245/g.124714  ORF Transcript_41245/g.124714 Transcript_41245/m.124714 type:complete len:299 (-) Transcript_41245:752-1648(-)